MTVLVGGGEGFVSFHIIPLLLNRGIGVVTIDNGNNESELNTIKKDVTSFKGNLNDKNLLLKVLHEHNIKTIIDLTAPNEIYNTYQDNANYLQSNIGLIDQKFEAISEYAAKLQEDNKHEIRYIQTLPYSVFGPMQENEVATEHSPMQPYSVYSAIAASAYHLNRSYALKYNIKINFLVGGTIYGTHQSKHAFIPQIVMRALEEKSIMVQGQGHHLRNWLHVNDYCRALFAMVTSNISSGKMICVAGKDFTTKLDIVNITCNILDNIKPSNTHIPYGNLIKFSPNTNKHQHCYNVSPESAERELGFKSNHSVQNSMEEIVKWYVQNSHIKKYRT